MKIVSRQSEWVVTHLRATFPALYDWDESDDPPPDWMEFDAENRWTICIDLDTGKVEEWPADRPANIYYEPGEGVFVLLDPDGNEVREYIGAIPDIIPNLYREAIDLSIDSKGFVRNWDNSRGLDEFLFDEEHWEI